MAGIEGGGPADGGDDPSWAGGEGIKKKKGICCRSGAKGNMFPGWKSVDWRSLFTLTRSCEHNEQGIISS